MYKADRYSDINECVDRLLHEYRTYGSLIIAYDYDNTVFDYHNRGDTFDEVIKLLRACKMEKFHLTVFTSCNDDRFPEIRQYLTDNDIPFNAINETPDFIPFKGRKVYFNHLLDDRAGLSCAIEILWKVISNIRAERSMQGLTEIG